jgi:hypothetical protein
MLVVVDIDRLVSKGHRYTLPGTFLLDLYRANRDWLDHA